MSAVRMSIGKSFCCTEKDPAGLLLWHVSHKPRRAEVFENWKL